MARHFLFDLRGENERERGKKKKKTNSAVQCHRQILDRLSSRAKNTHVPTASYSPLNVCGRKKILKTSRCIRWIYSYTRLTAILYSHTHHISIRLRSLAVFECQSTWPMIMTGQINNTFWLARSSLEKIDLDMRFRQLEMNIFSHSTSMTWVLSNKFDSDGYVRKDILILILVWWMTYEVIVFHQ